MNTITGTTLEELQQHDLTNSTIHFNYDHQLSPEELATLQSSMSPYLVEPLRVEGNNVVARFGQQPDGIGLVWFIALPLIAVAGFMGWQLVKPGGSLENLLEKPLFILAIGGVVMGLLWVILSAPKTSRAK